MFTGRIEEVGEIESVVDERVVMHAPQSAGRVRAGGSLNVAGRSAYPIGSCRGWRRRV